LDPPLAFHCDKIRETAHHTEIARLQNSLKHLRETQIILSSHPKDSDAIDDENLLALEENKVVMYVRRQPASSKLTVQENSGSQEERISILRMALAKRGILVGSHYDLPIQDIGKQEVNPGQGVYL
jgi:hypothetical protein